MKAFSYIRWSSDIQTRGDSLTRQLEATRKICETNNWELDETLKDEGVSAFTGSNLESGPLARFLKSVNKGEVTTPCVLVVEQLDRLTRTSLREARRLFEGLLEKGVKICTAHNGKVYDENTLDDPFALLMSIMELKAAHDYSANLSRRVGAARQRAKEAAAKDGTIFTRGTPAWLIANRKTNKFTIDELNVETLRRIFDSFANGKGLRTIMRELNTEKVPTFARGKQNKGSGWSNTHIRRLLSYRGVLGEYQPHKYVSGKRIPDGAAIPNFYPPVIDKPTFYKVQEILERQTHKSGNKQNATNLFTGLVKCAKCNGSMVIKRSGLHRGNPKWSYVSLVCSNAMRDNGCKYHTIQYSWVERAVLTILWSKVLPMMAETNRSENRVAALTGDLEHVKAKYAKLLEQIEKEGVTADGVLRILANYELAIRTLNSQIQASEACLVNERLTVWKQVPNTIDNRLRLQPFLAEEIESLSIDAEKLMATLKIKDPQCEFDLAWTRNNKNGFTFSSGKESPYLDNLLVWKTEQSISNLHELQISIEEAA